MSLIQEALEKTSCAPMTQTKNTAPKFMTGDPMGAHLEKELTRVQKAYAQRRVFYRTWGITGALLLGAAGILLYWGYSVNAQKSNSGNASPAVTVRSAEVLPQRTYYNVPFRLTGITNMGAKSVALINGQIVGVGDSLSGKAVVKSIDKGSVLLEARGKEIRLEL